MGIFIFRRDNLSTLKIENHKLNFMMPYRKNGKGRANVRRKLKRFKIGKRPLVLTTPWESHTYREALFTGVLLLAISAGTTGQAREALLGMPNCLPS